MTMTLAVTNDNNTPLIVPRTVHLKTGFQSGQKLEIKASGGVITIVPKAPPADHEYSPEQRRSVDPRLRQALEEVRRGHTAGPFNTADELIASLKRELKKRRIKKPKPRSR
jgi:hypothetical protein